MPTSTPWSWPALAGAEATDLPAALRVERAVWGKVHGASSDFRWIAATRGFSRLGAARDRGLEAELTVGAEDRLSRFTLWRSLAELHLAAACYPSRARDGAGRSGFLEKQLFAWGPEARSVPVAAGALLLLPAVAELDDQVWWGRIDPVTWDTDREMVLRLGDANEVSLSDELLRRRAAEGLEALRSLIEPSALSSFYARLLAGERPAPLAGSPEPLPPTALGALLLPLDRGTADGVSLASWLPSGRTPAASLASRWDGIATPSDAWPAGDDRVTPSQEVVDRARRMAEAILTGDPSRLEGTFSGRPSTGPVRPAATPRDERAPVREPEPAPARAETRTETRTELPPALPEPLELAAPPPGAAWTLVHDFARRPARRWLDPAALAAQLEGTSPHDPRTAAELLHSWIRTVSTARPAQADPDQWEVKEDLLRAVALALLYVSALREHHRSDVLRRLGPSLADELLRHSRSNCAPELSTRIDQQ
jgi:hypothetical protein